MCIRDRGYAQFAASLVIPKLYSFPVPTYGIPPFADVGKWYDSPKFGAKRTLDVYKRQA